MAFYVRLMQDSQNQVWDITDRTATRLGVTNPEDGPGCFFRADDGEDIFNAIKRGASGWFEPDGTSPFHRMALDPGQYYPRIARRLVPFLYDPHGWTPTANNERDTIAMTRGQLTILVRRLDDIRQTVHPDESNLRAYGHEIRNLLMLACTEVESQWRGVLLANGMDRQITTTNDYFELQRAMKLSEYTVEFPQYPWLPGVSPFEGWATSGQPTRALGWYNSYNAAKHDRENKLADADLGKAFEAVAAAAVMLAAQFGVPQGLGQRTVVSDFFYFTRFPAWEPSEVYSLPYNVRPDWQPTSFPFGARSGR